MGELIAALMIWINAYTGLPVPAEQPLVLFVDQCEIRQIYAGSGAVDCEDMESMRAAALYMPERKTVYLPDTWQAGDLGDVSMLLHELVHHMQAESGQKMKDTGCTGGLVERPAYDAQEGFLRGAGLDDPYKAMGINKLLLFLITQCRGAM